MQRFHKKVCVVTGAASGIGRATAKAFAQQGGKVVVSDVSSKAKEVVEELNKNGFTAIFVYCDISNWDSVNNLVETTVNTFGSIDCAVNSAGIAGKVSLPIHEYPFDQWQQQISVNLTGAWYFLKAVTNQMLQQEKGGNIAMVASAAGLRGQPTNTPYAAAKHGVVGLTKTVALEYAEKNIRVNCVCPTAIETPMLMQGRRKLAENPEALNAAINYQAMKRMGQPEEVANVNLWLCSEESSFITGRALPVDGGALIK